MLDFLRKRDYIARLAPDGVEVVVKGGERLLNAALAAGLDWPHDCRVGSCGTCRCRLLNGRIKALTDFTYTLTPPEIREGVILACQTVLRSDVEVDVRLGAGVTAHAFVDGVISAMAPLTADIRKITVEFEPGAFSAARAGQYVEFTTDRCLEPRSYSFAHAPTPNSGQAVFFIRHVPGGAFTDWLFAADRTGERVSMRGPYGSFCQHHATGRMICVAGGSGLAPLHALLQAGVEEQLARDCIVLFGARTINDLYYLGELAALGRRWNGSFALIPVLSDEPAGSSWSGARGLVTGELAAVASVNPFNAADEGYLCGPPAMVDAGVAAMRAHGMADSAIHADRFLDASTLPGGRGAGLADERAS